MDNLFSSDTFWLNLSIPVELESLVRRHFLNTNSMHSRSTEMIFILMYSLIGCIGISVNLVVIMVILSNKRLRNMENDLVLNLCAADILLCLWCIPFTLYQILRRDWSLGQLMCSTVPFLQATIIFVIAQTITVIAFDRLSVITGQHSLKRKHWSTLSARASGGGSLGSPSAYCCPITKRIPLIWISSFLLGSPLIYFYREVNFNYNGMPLYNRCIEDWSVEVRIVYSTVTFTVSLVIPIICLVASQIKIVSFLKHQGNLDIRPALFSQGTISSINHQSICSTLEGASTNESIKSRTLNLSQSAEAKDKTSVTEKSALSLPEGWNFFKKVSHLTAKDTSAATKTESILNLTANQVNSVTTFSPSDSSKVKKDGEPKTFQEAASKKRRPLVRYSVTLRPVRFKLTKGNRNRRAIVSLYRVSVTFILSWLPLNLVNLYLDLISPPTSLSGTKVYIILAICHLIAISSSVTNAIFYGLMNTNIKRELSKLKLKLKRKANRSPSLDQPSTKK